jgi:hypothetical protein
MAETTLFEPVQTRKRTGVKPTDPDVLFWRHVVRRGPNECWGWIGAKHPFGYGCFEHRRLKQTLAHRISYILLVGPILDGLELDHLCRNPQCCNPAHLEPVTGKENKARGTGVGAKNITKTHCPHGHEYTPDNTWTSKMNERNCITCKRENARRYYERKRLGLVVPRRKAVCEVPSSVLGK